MANKELNTRLLQLAAFEGDELETFLPDWLKCVETVGLCDEDIRYAVEEYIPQNWDVQYLGIRKLVGAFLRELVELIRSNQYKAEGKKIIYGILPASTTPYVAFKHAAGDDAFVSFPDYTLVTILNGFFHKAGPFLEKAEKEGFTYGCRHCPLNKMRLTAASSGLIPEPDVIWSWGFGCDEGAKTDEMIQALTGNKWRYIVSRAPHDTHIHDKVVQHDDEDKVKYFAQELKIGMEKISEITGIYPTVEDMNFAISECNRFMFKVSTLTNLVCKSDPVPLSGTALTVFSTALSQPYALGFKYIEDALDTLIVEIRKAVKEGKGVLPKGAPKVGCYFFPFCNPWIDRLFRENGIATTFSVCMAPARVQMMPPKYTEDPYMGMAESYLKMPTSGLNLLHEVAQNIEKVTANKPDAMIMGFYDFDRWVGINMKVSADLVEKETGIPHYYIESDFWDDRDYSEESLRTRIESISQLIHMRKDME